MNERNPYSRRTAPRESGCVTPAYEGSRTHDEPDGPPRSRDRHYSGAFSGHSRCTTLVYPDFCDRFIAASLNRGLALRLALVPDRRFSITDLPLLAVLSRSSGEYLRDCFTSHSSRTNGLRQNDGL